MLTTTAAQLALNDAIPEDLRDYHRVYDKKHTQKFFQTLAEQHPEKYKDVLFKLSNLGRDAAYFTGGTSFGPEHLRATAATQVARAKVRQAIQQILEDRHLDPETRQKRIIQATQQIAHTLTNDNYREALAENNPLATQVLSGSRGSPTNLRSLTGFDAAYQDHSGNIINMPILRNYSEGLSPAEYFASTFGARSGVLDTKLSTQRSGYFAKQMTQLLHRLLVSADEDTQDLDNKRYRGLPVSIDDPDNVGALLAIKHGPYMRNTVLTPKIIQQLKNSGLTDLLVRSPTVGGPEDGGVYARDVGMREKGRVAPIGDYVGIAAAQAVSEVLTQGALSSKHSGGVAGTGPSGFEVVNRMVQVPENFVDGATHAQQDGYVGEIHDAPQGGWFVHINGVQHYVPPDRKLKVKSGDEVEAGDVLTDGIPNPAEIVKHKGIGEGRRYFTNAFRDVYKNSNLTAHRRNIELVARGLINHVKLNDIWGDYAPDDVVPYHTIEHNWTPRPGTVLVSPKDAVGKYLEVPVLHHTIGTKVRKSMLPALNQFGVKQISVHPEAPPFEPDMERAASSISHDPDWQTRLIGSGQKGSILDAVHRGDISNTMGTSYVPALIQGKGFAQHGLTKGWKP